MKNLLRVFLVGLIMIWSVNVQSRSIKPTPDIESKHQAESSDTATDNAKTQEKSPDKPLPLAPHALLQTPANKIEQATDEGTEFWSPLFGYKLKITDTLLVAFTCFLFVATVGLWKATRKLVTSAEIMTRRTERAYLIGGGPAVIRNSTASTMTIHNVGKTPGFITKIQWGLCDAKDFYFDKLVSTIINEKLIAEIKTVDEDNVWPPAPAPVGMRHVTIDYHSKNIGRIFFGRIDYKDIFGDSHYSTFKLELTEGGSRTLPGSYSEDNG